MIAEHVGDSSPDGTQHLLLARAGWDADGVRDDVGSYVVEHLGARSEAFFYATGCAGRTCNA